MGSPRDARALLGPPKYGKLLLFGLYLEVSGHAFTYLWGPGRSCRVGACQPQVYGTRTAAGRHFVTERKGYVDVEFVRFRAQGLKNLGLGLGELGLMAWRNRAGA